MIAKNLILFCWFLFLIVLPRNCQLRRGLGTLTVIILEMQEFLAFVFAVD